MIEETLGGRMEREFSCEKTFVRPEEPVVSTKLVPGWLGSNALRKGVTVSSLSLLTGMVNSFLAKR